MVVTLDDLLGDPPIPVATGRQFLLHSVVRKYHLRNSIERWNCLYKYYGAEYCEIRRRLFRKAHARQISEVSSTELCLTERYTACVNFSHAKDGLLRHVCDLLPIVIGSDLDFDVRRDFWAKGRPTILEDIPKIGFIIQNKNYHNFTSCLTTNPKVCHIYRRNTKLQNTEVRLYFYDHNFRGNKLYLKQSLVFERCACCFGSAADEESQSGQNHQNQQQKQQSQSSQCSMKIYVLETLMLRNCCKHDYTFITRRCERAEKHPVVRETIDWLCSNSGGIGKVGGDERARSNQWRRPTCLDIFSANNNVRTLKYQCAKNASSFVLCDCASPLLMRDYVESLAAAAGGVDGAVDCAAGGSSSDNSITFDNVDRMQELNDMCFVDTAADQSVSAVEKMFTLFIYMHEVLLRNEDIDLLCNKCIFEGPILYGQFMQQLSSYLCDKYPLPALFTDVVDTLISKMRELSHTGNLYMLISRKTNIRVDLTNDMKRLLKTNVKREKMQNIDVCSNMKTFTCSTNGATASSIVSAAIAAAVTTPPTVSVAAAATFTVSTASSLPSSMTGQPSVPDASRKSSSTLDEQETIRSDAGSRQRVGGSTGDAGSRQRIGGSTVDSASGGSVANTLDAFAANSNADFLLRRKQRSKRLVLFDTEALRRYLLDNTSVEDESKLCGWPAGDAQPTSGKVIGTDSEKNVAMDDDDYDDDDDDDDDDHVMPDVGEETDDDEYDDDDDDDDDEENQPRRKRSRNCGKKIRIASTARSSSTRATAAGAPITSAAATIGSTKTFYTGMDPFRPNRVLVLYSSIKDYNSRQLLNYGNLYLLQGISAAHYTDTEFIFEQIKRPRITNQQNSSKCALIPRGFLRFLSFYNIGNLSTAGRSMNLCSRTKLSFFVNPVIQVAERYFQWFVTTYRDDSLFAARRTSARHCIAHDRFNCVRCFLYLIINEVPYCSVSVDKRLEYPMFLMSKLRWSGVQFYRKSHSVLSVSIQSGITMIPMTVSFPFGDNAAQQPHPPQQQQQQQQQQQFRLEESWWRWCDLCGLYFADDERFCSAIFRLTPELATTYQRFLGSSGAAAATAADAAIAFTDGSFRMCPRHVWFSPNDLRYYELFLRDNRLPALSNPFYYEIVCHGAFVTGRNLASVDISKTIVSINAAKRRLRLGCQLFNSLASPFETLMDQNARILVYDHLSSWRRAVCSDPQDFMALSDARNEPLRDVIAVPNRNSFYCCFMFGDYHGFNCEDAYVFDSNSRPFVENVIQLKVNYYKFDRSVIKTNMVQFFFRPQITLNPGNGCTILLGEILTYYRLSFGSTMINVKMIQHNNQMYRYCLSYTSNAAYLRRGSRIFEDQLSDHGLEFDDPIVTLNRYNNTSFNKHNSKSSIIVLYDAVAQTRNGNVVIGVQVSTRQLRFRISLKNVRTTQKIQNNCGQKGMPVYRDLSDLYTSRGGRVHIVVSSYSLLGRQPLSQLLEQRSSGGCSTSYGPLMPVYSREAGGRQVGWAGYGEFFFSCDSPHDNIIVSGPNCGNNPMRICNLTYYAAIDSGLSTAIFNRISDHENYKNNPTNGVPLNIYKLLSVYRYFNRDFEFRDFAARRAREQLRDYIFLRSLDVNAELPDYLCSDELLQAVQ